MDKLKTVDQAKQALQDHFDSMPEGELKERLLALQWSIDTQLGLCKDDKARYNKMVSMFYDGLDKFKDALTGVKDL